MDVEALIHFLGGAIGGTAGTAITCPLEVIKTRLQSSAIYALRTPPTPPDGPSTSSPASPSQQQPIAQPTKANQKSSAHFERVSTEALSGGRRTAATAFRTPRIYSQVPLLEPAIRHFHTTPTILGRKGRPKVRLTSFVADIIRKEGFSALYKGLLPNLVGVTPSKAIYFCSYSSSKRFWNDSGILVPNSAGVHMISAGSAGFVAATAVNPIWLVKTRLQLHQGPLPLSTCIRRIYTREGIRGFYKGVTASYMGISETIIQFVLYEHFRSIIDEGQSEKANENARFFNFMLAGGMAKFLACLIAYPHEVIRTRLREEDSMAKGFFSTLFKLCRQDGFLGLYRGLSVQLMRSVPNTAITMGAYEVVVAILHSHLKPL